MCDPRPVDAGSSLSRRTLLESGAAAMALIALPAAWRPRLGEAGDPASESYADFALRAERWIARSAIRAANGVTWPADPLDARSVQENLYSGSPGVVLFYLELAHATGDRRWLEPARDGARYLAATLPASASSLGAEGAGLYTGAAGIVYVLELAYRATGDDALAWLDRHGGAWDGWQGDAARAGDRLMEAAIPEYGGVKWGIAPTVPRRYPNFSHGTAGVSYTLATLRQETGERRFLDGALAGERYLRAIATRTPNDGLRIFHSEPGGEDLFYLSWCHGPAGTARLYHRLAEVTGDASSGLNRSR